VRHTALVTGGARGIGAAVVTTLAEDAWVASLDCDFPEGPGAAAASLSVDVRDGAAVGDAVEQILRERGGIDWVVCAAGIVRDRVSWKMTDAEWNDVLDVNLTGAFKTVRAALPGLRQSAHGRLVFISSINGLRGNFGQANYAAAKAGLVGLARSMALELARHGVTVNVVAPGFIDTAMTRGLPQAIRERALLRTPLGRTGTPDEVGALVRFLCSDAAAFITGAVVPIDGGQLLGGGFET